jgi:hypothetical protein
MELNITFTIVKKIEYLFFNKNLALVIKKMSAEKNASAFTRLCSLLKCTKLEDCKSNKCQLCWVVTSSMFRIPGLSRQMFEVIDIYIRSDRSLGARRGLTRRLIEHCFDSDQAKDAAIKKYCM